jgi:hypothetical protein
MIRVRGKILSAGRTNALEEAGRDSLPGLKKQLSKEYVDQTEDNIDEAARHALNRLAGARVQGFVEIFAWRHAREHLRRAS